MKVIEVLYLMDGELHYYEIKPYICWKLQMRSLIMNRKIHVLRLRFCEVAPA